MAYIGRSVDKISNIETLDNITFDGSSSYSLTKNSVAFVPSASQNILISIDGVVQSGNFTVSGSTIDFGVAISSSSVCNFIIHLGVGLVTSPSDGSVGTSQLASGAVTNDKISATAGISTTKLGTGAVIQVVFSETNDRTAFTTTTFGDVSGLSATITPTSTSSKILVCVNYNYSCPPNFYGVTRLLRNTTEIGSASSSGSNRVSGFGNFSFPFDESNDVINSRFHVFQFSKNYLDSPSSTSSLTYKIQARGTFNESYGASIGAGSANNGDQLYTIRHTCTMTLMEIAG